MIVFWDGDYFAGLIRLTAKSKDDAIRLARLVRERLGGRVEFRVYDSH